MKTKARAVKVYEGNIEITKENQAEWQERLKDVKKILGYVIAYQGASITLPVVKQTGYVRAYQGASITLPVVKQTGDVRAEQGASITLPEEAKTPNQELSDSIRAEIFHAFRKEGYLFADGMLTRIVSKRKAKQVVVWETKSLGLGKLIYVVQRGELFAHGDTIKQASHDLRYKLNDRDTTFCEKWTLDSVHPIADMIQAYRAITGACETGTKHWCEGKAFPSKVSVKVAIRLTREAYAGSKFAAFFKKGAEAKA